MEASSESENVVESKLTDTDKTADSLTGAKDLSSVPDSSTVGGKITSTNSGAAAAVTVSHAVSTVSNVVPHVGNAAVSSGGGVVQMGGGLMSRNSPLLARGACVPGPGKKFVVGGPGLPHSSSHTLLSANEHISNLLNQKKLSDSNSDVSLSNQEISPQNRRQRTFSSNLSEVDSTSRGNLSRCSSTMSLASMASNSNTGLGPLGSIVKHLRERLSGAIFSGWYRERRYVDAIERYRDLVVADPLESLVVKQVKYAIRKSAKVLGDNVFVGLSIVEEECRIFTSLGTAGTNSSIAEYPFGHYWYQVRQINFQPNVGFVLELFVIRPFAKSDSDSCWRCKEREMEAAKQPPVHIDSLTAALTDIKTRLDGVASQAVSELWQPESVRQRAGEVMTLANLWRLLRLACVLVMAGLTAAAEGIKHAANFSLKTLHELAFLVDRSTPLALGALNIFSKIVGGFYLLIAMMWRDTSAQRKNMPPLPPSSAPSRPLPLSSDPVPRPLPQGRLALASPTGGATSFSSSSSGLRSRGGPTPSTNPSPLSAMDTMYSSHKNW